MDSALRQWGIEPLRGAKLLQDTNSFIAGSFLLWVYETDQKTEPTWKPNDIDIWVPPRVSASKTNPSIVEWTMLLLDCGYSFPPIREAVQNKGRRCYRRLSRCISEIVTFKHAILKTKVQLLQLTSTQLPQEIIQNFDLTLVQMFWPGTGNIIPNTQALEAVAQKQIVVALETSDDVKMQSIKEWIRTLARMVKYESRGFRIARAHSTILWLHLARFFAFDLQCLKACRMALNSWNSMLTHEMESHSQLQSTDVPLFLLRVEERASLNSDIRIVWTRFSRTHTFTTQLPFQADHLVDMETSVVVLPNECVCITEEQLINNGRIAANWRKRLYKEVITHLANDKANNIAFTHTSLDDEYMHLTTRTHINRTMHPYPLDDEYVFIDIGFFGMNRYKVSKHEFDIILNSKQRKFAL